MFHTVYKTTCLVTGKFYIGIHSTKVVEDSYLGSGKKILRSIKAYGRKNHIKEILHVASSREEAFRLEKAAVAIHLGTPQCLNIVEGGSPSMMRRRFRVWLARKSRKKRRRAKSKPSLAPGT